MSGDNLTFPAVLIISRPSTAATPAPFVIEDDRIVNDQAEAAQRQTLYERWAVATRTAHLYTYTLAPAAEVETAKARLLAELAPAPVALPEPERPANWGQAVKQAAKLAAGYFGQDSVTQLRLARAVGIAMGQNWQRLGDPGDTWAMASQAGKETYLTNGRCSCLDYKAHAAGWWCKHRMARAIAKRAAELMAAE